MNIRNMAERLGIVDAPVELDEETLHELRLAAECEALLKSMTENAGWKVFHGIVKGLRERKAQELLMATPKDLAALQGAAKELDLVLNIVPEAIARGAQARKELEQNAN